MFAISSFSFWLIVGMMLLILEILLGAEFYLLSFAIAAIIPAILATIFKDTFILQSFCFALTACLLTFLLWQYRQKNPKDIANNLNNKADLFIGKTYFLTKAIKNGSYGKVKVADTVYLASSENNIEENARVKVMKLDGTIFVVEKV